MTMFKIGAAIIVLMFAQMGFAGDVKELYVNAGLHEFDCWAKGRFSRTCDIFSKCPESESEDYSWRVVAFAKSEPEAYQIALNQLKLRRIYDGSYTSVDAGPKDGTGLATVEDLTCKQLPVQNGK